MDQKRFLALIDMRKLCMGIFMDSDLPNEKSFTARWCLLLKRYFYISYLLDALKFGFLLEGHNNSNKINGLDSWSHL